MSDGPRKIAVVSPTGKAGLLSEEDLDGALQAGFRVETPEEAQSREEAAKFADRPVAAFAAGAGRSVSLGLSDLALTKTGLVEPETLRGLQQHNPGASIAGEVAGAVAPALIPGVGAFTAGGLAARASAGAARGAARIGAGGIAAKAAGAVAEGAVFGVGTAISEDVLEDGNLDLAGEKLLTHVGLGSVLGGAFGGGGAAIEKALSKTFRRVGAKAAGALDDVAGAADDVAEAVPAAFHDAPEQAAAAPGGRFSAMPDIEDLPDDEAIAGAVRRHATTIKDVIEKLGIEFPTPENLVTRDLDFQRTALHRMKKKGVADFGARELLDDARYAGAKEYGEKVGLLKTKKSEAAQKIDEAVSFFDDVATPEERWSPGATAERIEREVLAKLEDGPAANKAIADRVRAEMDRLLEIPEGERSFRAVEQYKRGLDDHINWNHTDSNEIKATAKAMRQVRGILNDDIEKSVKAVAERAGDADAFNQWKLAKRKYGAMAEFTTAADKREAAKEANRYFSLTDYLAGNIVGGGASVVDLLSGDGPSLDNLAYAGAGMLANKWGRERLAHVMALQLEKLAKNKTSQVAAKAFAGAFKKAEAQATEKAAAASASAATTAAGGAGAVAAPAAAFWTKYGPVLSTAAAKGANALYATHVALSQGDPEYGEGVQMAGFRREAPEESRAGMRKAAQLAAIQEAAAEHDRSVGEAVDGFLKSKGSGRVAVKGLSTKEYRQKLEELADLTNNPEALIERLQGGATLASSAPGVASAVASAATRAVQFLHAKAPKDPYAAAMPGMQRDWEPSAGELSRWARYVRAVENPTSVLEDMKQGTVTQEAIEALRSVYPQLAQDVQARLTNALSENPRALGYQQKLALSALMGRELEPTAAPATVQFLQSIHNQAQQQQQQKPPTTGQRIRLQDGATTSQRIEGKRS